jgi:hypothetical protein
MRGEERIRPTGRVVFSAPTEPTPQVQLNGFFTYSLIILIVIVRTINLIHFKLKVLP